MNLGKVTGHLWAAAKHQSLIGAKLLVVHLLDSNGHLTSTYEVACDTVDAGVGDTVLTVRGSSARMTRQTEKAAIDCAIVGVVDHVQK